MKINEMKTQERTTYRATLQDRYTAETREIKVEAINEEHAKLKARAKAEMFEFVASVAQEPTGQAKTDRENRDHCRRIAEDLEDYANGNVCRCPECNEIIALPDDVGDKYRCPDCGTVHDVDDLEQLSMWDYLEDALDFRFLIDSRRDVLAVKILIAYGGPNIWIDTESRAVELYWWTDRASYPISGDVCDALEEWAEEYLQC